MKKSSLLIDYLNKYAVSPHWKIYAGHCENIRQAVVIPAYSELEMLFDSLASITGNSDSLLDETLVICVINNKADAPDTVRENNSDTAKILEALIERRSLDAFNGYPVDQASLKTIDASRLRLGYIDAFSPGLEIPNHVGGVGMARKIGMDTALRLFQKSEEGPQLICSLDADTIVHPAYLTAVKSEFSKRNTGVAVVRYEHQIPPDIVGRNAICAYEIHLRYWTWGLKYAGSPYAFHTIGSTMVTTSQAYLSVRGMNRREAGEDFYFLNKLAKISPVYTINDTVVYPSARISGRVPFGTGATVSKIAADNNQEYRLYDPRVFMILKSWLGCMGRCYDFTMDQILAQAKGIHEGLEQFLIVRKFDTVWPKIRRNVKDPKTCTKQFHNWFDGFETLKLINHLTREYFPKVGMIQAVRQMAALQNDQCPTCLTSDDQLEILECMRKQDRYGTASLRYQKE